MKLHKFIEQTLLEITEGVYNARSKAVSSIAPFKVNGHEVPLEPQLVSFQVNITTSSEAKAGIDVVSVAALKGDYHKEEIHKVSFDVPVYFSVFPQVPKE